jgi:adenylyltransferase/sulfurtransferase
MNFTEAQINRYARHILLKEVGGEGQARLLGSKVLVIGAGGLGSPMLLYLAAAGVGTIGVVDDDVVDLSNLQRQIVHSMAAVGTPKVESAKKTLRGINPDVKVIAHRTRIAPGNALDLIADYDVVADGSDNFATRFLLNDACHLAGRTLVSAAMLRFEGQISTFKSCLNRTRDTDYPCYRCLYREPPPPGMVPSCSEAGILGALAGVVGSLQTTEVLKEVLGIGESLAGQLVLYDALSATFRKIRIPRDPACPLCGDQPSIADLAIHRPAHAGA